ncbi:MULTISPECIES: RNA polymerase sigma factor [unclassified Iodidimonas]|uniref:RNA polymerase sigma factor n=1 Tax=unclassified Iodidimonas TaxID=2626145 RepID=UPI00248254A9|nr:MULTISPECIES: RNA polymerase sigma factor [unclassified Iodidimonas]
MIAREIPALRRYARILMRGRGDKDDLVQDTLERVIRKSHSWRREGSIRSWLYRVQYTVFLNRYSKQANLKEVAADDMSENPALSINASQDVRLECHRMFKALENLKPRHSEVLLLVAVEGFSYDQAAQIMNIPVGTVRSRLTRARADLRAEMKNTALNHETIQKPSKETVRTPS